jgi:proteic killer suppression protein
MIKTFNCKYTQSIFEGKCPRRFKAFATVAERKLQMLDDAYAIEDLRVPPGNRLEALHGDRKGQWSIRINDQMRLCFRFKDGNAYDVEIVDYH